MAKKKVAPKIDSIIIEPVSGGYVVEIQYRYDSCGNNKDAEKYVMTSKAELDAKLVELL